MGWWERWRQRQQELAEGADADLVRDNRKKWLWSIALSGAGSLMLFVFTRIRLWKPLEAVVLVVGFGLFIAGFLLGRWALAESCFPRQA
jgi:hypothetical protein